MSDMFGCCSKFVDCSDNRKCVYLDNPWSEGCYYRRNLESGKIFYGKNKNLNYKGEKEIMEIKIVLEAPELSAAIRELAGALSGGLTRLPAETTVKGTTEAALKKTAAAAKAKDITPAPTLAPEPEIIPEVISEVIEDVDPLAEEEEVKVYTLEEVRAKLTGLSQGGKSAAVKQLITSYGVAKLTDIPADKYTEVMEKAGKM